LTPPADGREIAWHANEDRLEVPDRPIIPFIEGDGTGPDIWRATRRVLGLVVDITARKAAEETLVQQAALAQVGQMAAVVAHEVRNPLAGIKGVIQVLVSRRAAGDPRAGALSSRPRSPRRRLGACRRCNDGRNGGPWKG